MKEIRELGTDITGFISDFPVCQAIAKDYAEGKIDFIEALHKITEYVEYLWEVANDPEGI